MKTRSTRPIAHTSVSSRYQTVIPSQIRDKFLIREGTRIAWIDKGESIEIVPLPEQPWKAFRGAGRSGVDYLQVLTHYRKEERERTNKETKRMTRGLPERACDTAETEREEERSEGSGEHQ
ncbi:MAG TPA: AbrB/MazE/SpoVT family DNA-binding domain-containing protein [Firmicutes bacterium]|uniref:AbrB/MazE/SpoVT family DNA-binding domain-containing protein n=1 Tax=Candidatus Fermentithermobacillus carboniphilus TaxID=3085328 RepID=A0AAT9LEX3_9FIRM|nr:MAG: AbrB/MazE/SpoVT family DNA-binding domain-containing protein [Candidatus Fermentithermobacillus carboniphilus]HHW18641.1 AbrB/MazE/SpoVT family DNA-binding domain-containing protein [Candidatus Fermentithermobacillaceae bacterium]